MRVANDTPIANQRVERVLAYMVAAAVGLSVVAFLAVIVATAAGVRDFSGGIWPLAIMLPAVGLPIGLLLMIALLATSAIRRSRESKDARK